MALHWQPLILLLLHLHSGVLVSSSPIEKNAQEAQDLYAKYRPQIWSVIDDLNADPERQYNYNFSDLLNTQKKVAILNLYGSALLCMRVCILRPIHL